MIVLSDRRPRRLQDMVGNQPIKLRLQAQFRNGSHPRRALMYGPTGGGKTTLAEILIRRHVCRQHDADGEPCGVCKHCISPSSYWRIEQWTAARLEDRWDYWIANGSSILADSNAAFFLDEAQDLSKPHQSQLMAELEDAAALVIFATTHKNALVEPLINRFGANVYELRRPSAPETVQFMQKLSGELDLRVTREQLYHVANFYGCDLRLCVDFMHTSKDQTVNGIVSNEFLEAFIDSNRQLSSESLENDGRVRL